MKATPRLITIGLLLLRTLTAGAFFDPTIGRWASRDPIGEEVFLRRHVQGRSRQEAEKLSQDALGPSYVLVGNDSLARVDAHGLTFADVLRKRATGRLPKMVGIDLTGAAVAGIGGAQAWSIGAAFFADTCEIAAFGVGPAVIQTSTNSTRPKWKLALLDMPVGLDLSISVNGSIAMYRGPDLAAASTWEGLFYGGVAGGGPLGEVGFGVFWDPNGYWIGGSVGVGVGVTPVYVRTNPQVYYMIAGPVVVPKCLCYMLIWQMP